MTLNVAMGRGGATRRGGPFDRQNLLSRGCRGTAPLAGIDDFVSVSVQLAWR